MILTPCPPFPSIRLSARTRPQHLTDFASQSAPKISVCSAKDMIAISPLDIITHLKFFLILVCALFGAMLLGAGLAGARDRLDSRVVLRKIKDAKCGFEPAVIGADGKPGTPGEKAHGHGHAAGAGGAGSVWLWTLYQESLDGDVFCVTGPIVNACGVIGIPFSRLRTAIPEVRTVTLFRHWLTVSAALSRFVAALLIGTRTRIAASE